MSTPIKYWKIYHGLDETNSLTQINYIQTTWVGISEDQRLEAEIMTDYAYRTYGSQVHSDDNGKVYRKWVLQSSTVADHENSKPLNFASSKEVADKYHIGIGYANGGMKLLK